MKQKSQQIKPNLPANQQPSTAAVAQPAQTGFTAPKQVTAEDMTNALNTPAQAQPAQTTATEQQKPMSYVDMLNAFYTPETADEKAKRERKEKWDKTAAAIGDGISALANLYYTTKGAPNSYDGNNSMSERTRQLYDKLDKDRKENDRWYLNYFMNAAKMDEDAKRYKDQIDYSDKQDAIKKEQYEEGIAHRNAREAVQDANTQWSQQFQQSNADWQHANTEQQQAEQKRQFWANHNLSVQNYIRQIEKENPTVGFALGNDRKANIKKADINPQNVSYVYNKLPKEIKEQYAKEQVFDSKGRPVMTTDANGKRVPVMKDRKLSENDMMVIIGEHIANYPDVQNAWREIGGEITSTSKNSGDNTPPSRVRNNNNDNTPPSRKK